MALSAGSRTGKDPHSAALAGPERRASANLQLKARLGSLFEYEAFADSLAFLETRSKMSVKLAGEEILDNIIRHAPPQEGSAISIRAALRTDGPFLGFYFHSPGFASFASRCGDFVPLFDPEHRRWRGIGLVMCRNLARRIVLRPGNLVDRIFLVFPRTSMDRELHVGELDVELDRDRLPDNYLVAK